jgi:cyclopropane fatty-acyl-phospholipid synthase-like methyltransferase
MTNIQYTKRDLEQLQKYQVINWVGKKRLDDLYKGNVKKLINHLQAEDHVLQKQAVYNGPLINSGYDIDGKDYGYNFFFLTDLTVSLLKECADDFKKGVEKRIIDIGSGWGATVWKELLAGCNTTAYDISYKLKSTSRNFDKYVSECVPSEIIKTKLTKIEGDIFNIYEEHPELLGSFDLINAQNLIHFFSPSNCLKFANIAYDLLKPKGKAFISAESYQQYKKDDPSCLEVYRYNKDAGNKFPAQIYYKSVLGSPAQCFKNNSKELFEIDPYYNKTNPYVTVGVDHRFDLETLEHIFESAGFEVQESFYLGFQTNGGVSGVKINDHPFAKFAGIIVTKPAELADEIIVLSEEL